MTSPRAPAGWYPDPSEAGVVRYWDGTTWTDLAAAPTQPLPVNQPAGTESSPDQPELVVRERTTPTWATIGFVLLTALLVIGIAVYVTNRVGEPDPPFGEQPADERAVVQLIEDARTEYADADHDLQRDAALATRDERICALLGDGRVEGWSGQVYEIDSDGDGHGIIGINIEPDTQVTNRNGAFAGRDTLILPGPLLDRVTKLETGQAVTFSGQFVPDDDGPCFTNPRITQRQSVDKPLMVFRFGDVRRQ